MHGGHPLLAKGHNISSRHDSIVHTRMTSKTLGEGEQECDEEEEKEEKDKKEGTHALPFLPPLLPPLSTAVDMSSFSWPTLANMVFPVPGGPYINTFR